MPTKHEINRSFLSQLNEPERSEALENYDKKYAVHSDSAINVYNALYNSFDFHKTKQGSRYWSNIASNVFNETYPFKTKTTDDKDHFKWDKSNFIDTIKTNQTMKHEVILNSKQPKQMTIADAPNGFYLEANGLFFIKTISGCLVKLNDCNDSAILNSTALCRILEPGESITINIK
jgi:hypothetical protein